MKIFPAIDIKDKKCVRLVKGDFENKTEYEISPVEQARKYKDHGFKHLHIVDLDGALTGETVKVADTSNCPVIISGGVSSIDDIKKAKGLNNKNIEGIIVGKAIYDGDIKLEELVKELDA